MQNGVFLIILFAMLLAGACLLVWIVKVLAGHLLRNRKLPEGYAALRLCDRLRVVRLSQQLDLSEAADLMGVRADTLAGWEDGSEDPSLEEMEKAAKAYQLPLEELLRGVTGR